MAVQPHRALWTDERLDDLNQTIRDGFARNDRDHQEFRAEMREFRSEMNERFDRQSERFDSLQRTMILGMFGLLGGIFAAVVGAIVTLG